jgi:hypothetical protein
MSAVEQVVKAVTDWPARYFFGLGTGAAILLAGSQTRWAGTLGLNDGPAWFRLALTATVVACWTVGVVKIAGLLVAARSRRVALKKNRRAFEQDLLNLTDAERMVFQAFIGSGTKVQAFVQAQAGVGPEEVAHSLAVRGYLFQLSRESNLWFTTVRYGIHPEVFSFLDEHCKALTPVSTLPPQIETP